MHLVSPSSSSSLSSSTVPLCCEAISTKKKRHVKRGSKRGTETVWEVIIPSHIVTGCGSINYTPENDDTWPVLVLGELRDRESRGEPAEESGVTSGRHDCSWIIKSNRHYRFIYPLREELTILSFSILNRFLFSFFSLSPLYITEEITENRWRYRNYLDVEMIDSSDTDRNETKILYNFYATREILTTVSLFVQRRKWTRFLFHEKFFPEEKLRN